jgi:hypothetical protein
MAYMINTDTRQTRLRSLCEISLRLASALSNHLHQPLFQEVVQFRFCKWAESHQFGAEHFSRTEAIAVRQRADGLGHQIHFDGHIRVRYRRTVQSLKVVAHAQYEPVLMPLDHVNIHIGVSKRRELSWRGHVMQTWKKLQQLNVVLMVEFHADSTLFSIREPSMRNR